MARILLHDDPNPKPDAGIVLLSYRNCIVLPYESDKSPCRYAYGPTSLAPSCPANRQDLVPICLRDEPDNRRANTPTTRTRLGRASLPRYTNMLAPYCHLHEPVAGTVLLYMNLSLASYCYLPPKSPVPDTWIVLSRPNTSLASYCCR